MYVLPYCCCCVLYEELDDIASTGIVLTMHTSDHVAVFLSFGACFVSSRFCFVPPLFIETEAKVLGVVDEDETQGQGPAVILDKTIFHPQGGGQPSDEGRWVS